MQEALELVNLLAEHLGGVTNTTDDTKTTGVSDCCSQLGPSSHVHACQHDGVVDLEQIGDGSADFLCKTAVSTECSSFSQGHVWGNAPEAGERSGNSRGEAIVSWVYGSDNKR